MAKDVVKEHAIERQEGLSIISGQKLPENLSHTDKHRNQPRIKGGKYTLENTVVMTPKEHLTYHGNFVDRNEMQKDLKKAVHSRHTFVSVKQKLLNQISAVERDVAEFEDDTIETLKEIIKVVSKEVAVRDKRLLTLVKEIQKTDTPEGAIIRSAIEIPGVGPNTIGQMNYWVDPSKCPHVSNLWAYFGLHCSAETRYDKKEPTEWKKKQIEEAKERGENLEASGWGGNKKGRTCLRQWADVQIKMGERSPYRPLYDQYKHRLENSSKITRTRVGSNPVRYEEKAWKDVAPIHRHEASIRFMIKHFLADYWYVSRLAYGLPVAHPTEDEYKCFAEERLSGLHKTVLPWERGWDKEAMKFKKED